ncbi:hypothetical protein GOP47_0008840 [Adiantum capillus-veneris]|uniref:Uncharacterized protein n=1 Tax=Adiantum capillus-veneris TaxID=13818 RepID=A0A9D4UZR1_ADICA|nr:hypothetical protein GOP47_0008840 [Adiantum capillus-veneris]
MELITGFDRSGGGLPRHGDSRFVAIADKAPDRDFQLLTAYGLYRKGIPQGRLIITLQEASRINPWSARQIPRVSKANCMVSYWTRSILNGIHQPCFTP